VSMRLSASTRPSVQWVNVRMLASKYLCEVDDQNMQEVGGLLVWEHVSVYMGR
jgi:hypothetical protein